MLNYRVEPRLLEPLVPRGVRLDDWRGETYVSVVGFLFRDTRVLGVPVPLHRHFEELNLRFYVREESRGEVRRGVTFIREMVPRRAIALVARLAYNEPYVAAPMRHRVAMAPDGGPAEVEYGWRLGRAPGRVGVAVSGEGALAADGSLEEFITEHYWGYTRQRDGGTVEYEVRHPRWRVWKADRATLDGDLVSLYGPAFADVLRGPPASAFLADGSPVRVGVPQRLAVGASAVSVPAR